MIYILQHLQVAATVMSANIIYGILEKGLTASLSLTPCSQRNQANALLLTSPEKYELF